MDTQGADAPRGTVIIGQDGLDALIGALAGAGYKVIGPTVSEGAIAYDEIDRAAQLPIGWTDAQAPGSYRLERRGDGDIFGFAVGRHFDARAVEPVRAFALDGNCLRAKCEADQHFGYELVKRFLPAGPHAAGAHPPATARRL
jgi:hypothetical protein